MELVKRFIREDDGVTAIEYALSAALIAVAIITSRELLGGTISDTFEEIEDAISNAGN
ncbi:MAG: Flp family type IVb pilin [Deltaproteobacteria bacterium]|nr:Flp family type IVb pilin [Deltaproteobacteria bacterium]